MSAELQRIKANLLDLIEEVTCKPKPNYSIDGQSVSWQTYKDSLFKNLKDIDAQINAHQPFEIVTRGRST